MIYDNQQIMKAFKIYSKLALTGIGLKDDMIGYLVDDNLRSLVDQFAEEVKCTVFIAGDSVYMIPKAISSEFHISNENIRKNHIPGKSTNPDIYLMYLIIIILFGEFYDGHQSINPTRDFISISDWLEAVNERILSLKEHPKEKLKELERSYEYNWISIINKWEPMDDLKESVKNQDARTVSRLSFINITKNFLKNQELIEELGNDEIELTEKAKIIIQKYYMEYEFNRGILDFIYNIEMQKGEE